MTKRLRIATDDDAKPRPLTERLTSSDRRERLMALLDIATAALVDPKTHPRDISPLTRRHQELADELEAMDAGEGDDEIGRAAKTPDEAWSS